MNQQGSSFAQQVQQGQFPHCNDCHFVGQLWPTQFMPYGVEWREGQQGRDGTLTVNFKVRKAWGGQNPGVSQKLYKLKAFGSVGQQILQQIQQAVQQCPSGHQPLFEFQGELVVKKFQYGNNTQRAGQWGTDVHVLIKQSGGRNGYIPFVFLGTLPQVDEGRSSSGGGGFGNGFGGGFQSQGGFNPPPQQGMGNGFGGQIQPQGNGFGGGQPQGGFAPPPQPQQMAGGGFGAQPPQPQQPQPQGNGFGGGQPQRGFGQPYSPQPQGDNGGFNPQHTPGAGMPQGNGNQPAGNWAPPSTSPSNGGGQAPPPDNPF